jgi:predicted neuraminidase
VLGDGTIVGGTSVESYRSWAVWIERSIDNGRTWTKGGPIVLAPNRNVRGLRDESSQIKSQGPESPDWQYPHGIIQPSVVALNAKHLRLYARSSFDILRIAVADSYDAGLTWTPARLVDVPNPNSGIDAIALRDGRVVLIYNNTPSGRTPLNLAVSTDGEHFRMFQTLENESGEYSYPALIQTGSGDLEITYTVNRTAIRHVHVPLADVPK